MPEEPRPKTPARPGQRSAKERITLVEQRRRFEETARELGCDDGQALDAAFGKIVPLKLPNMRDK